jgi:hypothetical protein
MVSVIHSNDLNINDLGSPWMTLEAKSGSPMQTTIPVPSGCLEMILVYWSAAEQHNLPWQDRDRKIYVHAKFRQI